MSLTREQAQEEYNRCEMVFQMTQQPGYAILQKHFDNILEVIRDQLLTEKNPAEIVRLQERYRAFEAMLEAASTMVAMRDVYEQELQDIAADELFDRKYAINS